MQNPLLAMQFDAPDDGDYLITVAATGANAELRYYNSSRRSYDVLQSWDKRNFSTAYYAEALWLERGSYWFYWVLKTGKAKVYWAEMESVNRC